MNSQPIRIRQETKIKIDNLMLKQMNEKKNPHYSYWEFIDELVDYYIDNKFNKN